MMFHHCLKTWRALWVPPRNPLTPLTPHLTIPHHTTPHHSTPHQTLVLTHTYSSAPSHTGYDFSRCNSPLTSSPRCQDGEWEKHLHFHLCLLNSLCSACQEGSSGTPGFLFSLPPSPLPPTVHLWRVDTESFPFLSLAKRDPPLNHILLLLHAGRERYRFTKKGIKMRDI